MNVENPFEADWRDCLQAHLAHVIREGDRRNEDSLITVLLDTGLSAQDVAEMRRQLLDSMGVVEIDAEVLEENTLEQPTAANGLLEATADPLPVFRVPAENPTVVKSEPETATANSMIEPVNGDEDLQALPENDLPEDSPPSFTQMSLF